MLFVTFCLTLRTLETKHCRQAEPLSLQMSTVLWQWISYLFLAALDLCCCTQAAHGLSLVAAHRLLISVVSLVAEHGLLGMRASIVAIHGLSSCSFQILERRLSSCDIQAYLSRDTWDLPRPGIEPVSSALAGISLTTGPSGKLDNEPLNCISLFALAARKPSISDCLWLCDKHLYFSSRSDSILLASSLPLQASFFLFGLIYHLYFHKQT